MNKTKELIGVGALLAVAGAVVGVHKGVFKKEPLKYSMEWIRRLSDADLKEEREIVQKIHCDPKLWKNMKIDTVYVLHLFDEVIRERTGTGRDLSGPAYRREHGFNLYKP